MEHPQNWSRHYHKMVESEWICIDESISQWNGLRGQGINFSLLMYIVIGWRPEND